MKICFLANAASCHVQRWVNYFAEHDWDVDLITWHPPDKVSDMHRDITIHRIFFPPHYLARYGALLEVVMLMRKIRPDIIHAHYIGHFGILAGLYSRLTGFKPIVMTAWGDDIYTEARGCKRLLIKYVLKRADYITCEAEELKQAMIELGADPEKIGQMCWAIDLQRYKPEQRSEKIREELNVFDSPTIISSKPLELECDIISLVQSIPLVLKEVPEAKFIIAGKGSQEVKLKRLADSLGVSDSIRWIGFIPINEYPKYIASADIYTCTSLHDGGLAISTKEAMACGLPVVINDFGDNDKWVKDGINGFIVPIKSPESLASKIIYLLRNKHGWNEFGRINRQIIEERANLEKEMGRIAKLYEELIVRYKE